MAKKGFITASTGFMIGAIVAAIVFFLIILLLEKFGVDLTPLFRAIPLPGLPAEPLGIGEGLSSAAETARGAASGISIPSIGQ